MEKSFDAAEGKCRALKFAKKSLFSIRYYTIVQIDSILKTILVFFRFDVNCGANFAFLVD